MSLTTKEKKNKIRKFSRKIANIYLFELSDVFANQVYLPYSSGVIWSYLKQDAFIAKNFQLRDWFYCREEISSILDKIQEPDVLIFSCFMWNWELNCEIAKKVKKDNPNTLIIFGGQHQPMQDRNEGFFEKYNFVDILVHHEGEETIKEILLGKNFDDIHGITYNSKNTEIRTKPRKRMNSIFNNPSPYLDGSFDWIVNKNERTKKYSLHATVESARGCPFKCAFCEIGDDYYKKVLPAYEKIKMEIEWIAQNKIEYVTDANSNFGLFVKQDFNLVEQVIKLKKTYGFPKAYRVTWAKGMADRVLGIAKLMQEHNLQKGMTIALQSMNPEVLNAVKRKNIHSGKLKEFIDMYESANISSYVELIWGLPEESLESFIEGITSIMENGYHNYLDIHLMMLLPNAPISSPEFRNKYGIKTLNVQPRFSHRSNPEVLVDDLVGFVVETNKCSREEWIEGHNFRWLVIFGHYLGPLQFIARSVRALGLDSYKGFYKSLLEFFKGKSHTFIGNEYKKINFNLNLILQNKRHWGDVVKGAGDINWEVDEATCIRLINDKELFYSEIKSYLSSKYLINNVLLDDIIAYQKSRLNAPFINYPIQSTFNHNIHEFISYGNKLIRQNSIYEFNGAIFNDLYEWAKNILWFGRRIARYKNSVRILSPNYESKKS